MSTIVEPFPSRNISINIQWSLSHFYFTDWEDYFIYSFKFRRLWKLQTPVLATWLMEKSWFNYNFPDQCTTLKMCWTCWRENQEEACVSKVDLAQHQHSGHGALPGECLWRTRRSSHTALLLLVLWLGSQRAKEKHCRAASERRQAPGVVFQ